MIKGVRLSNFGPIRSLTYSEFSKINLFIGANRSGKTTLLKAMYSAIKAVELYGRGKNIKKINELLFDKLYWTFQSDRIGDIASRPDNGALTFSMTEDDGGMLSYSFSSKTEKQIVNISNTCAARNNDSVFIPAKEVLSLLDIIIQSREEQRFGFDDTYYDLAKALRPTTQGKNIKVFSKSRKELEGLIDGRLEYDKTMKKWIFTQGRQKFDIALTSEGTKKIAILDTLLGNHYLSKSSIIFIDEPEAGLHPELLVKFLDIISMLSDCGIQVFIASHSYFVIKKLYLIAQKKNESLPVISFGNNGNIQYADLQHGMPDNPIISQSVELYKEEMSL